MTSSMEFSVFTSTENYFPYFLKNEMVVKESEKIKRKNTYWKYLDFYLDLYLEVSSPKHKISFCLLLDVCTCACI